MKQNETFTIEWNNIQFYNSNDYSTLDQKVSALYELLTEVRNTRPLNQYIDYEIKTELNKLSNSILFK